MFACLYACNPAPPYQYIQSPTGQQMVVVRDDNGAEFLMEYMLFTSLMNSGGYNNVIHHYHTNTAIYPRYNRSSYGGWKSFKGRSYSRDQYDNWHNSNNSGFRSSGNSRPATFKNTSPSSSPATFRNTTPSSPSSSWRATSPKGSSSSSGFRSSSNSRSSSSSGFRSSSSRSSSSSGFRSKRN